jgi:[NiFe] hydrogenase assembly HybE family chaperone
VPAQPTAAQLAARIEAHYRAVAAGPMADVPLCNPRLSVRVARLVEWGGVRVAALVMPWAINLLILPGSASWQAAESLAKIRWRFPSGDYEFVYGTDVGFGPYQVCSLFSPALEFDAMDAACDTASAALIALLQAPVEPVEARPDADVSGRRRWLFGRHAA